MLRTSRRLTLAVCFGISLMVIATAATVDGQRATPAAASPGRSPVLLWPDGAPGAVGRTEADQPAIVPYVPALRGRTGAGVLIIPGGTAGRLNDRSEGADVATWLNGHGIAAFVLRYRLEPRYDRAAAQADVVRAMRVIQARADTFGIDPARVAAMGFGRGAALESAAFYARHASDPASPDPVARQAGTPALMALVYGASPLPADAVAPPPTFLVGSTRATDNQGELIDLWNRLRAVRTPVDAHFFAKADVSAGLATADPSLAAWPQSFLAWATYRGLLTAGPRVPMTGFVYVDGRPLPHGYVVFTPVDQVGAGPIVGRVLNSTANVPIGQFTVPAAQGPTPGRYRVEVHQNARRWLSNAFTPTLTTDPAFGHSRILSPSIDDQRVFRKQRSSDAAEYTIDISATSQPLRIDVWSDAPASPSTPPRIAGLPDRASANPGVAAYLEQLTYAPGPAAGTPAPTLLWPDGAPGAVPDAAGVFTDEDRPALLAFPVKAPGAPRAALLILPGGAFTNRVEDHEGVQIARWLNRHGIGGFVLRYRLRPNYNGQVSTMDAHRAMRYLRSHAAELGIDPNRIGVIGFSAGAELEGDAFFNSTGPADPQAGDPIERVSAASNFNVLIYGGRNLRSPETAPPTFMFVTLEDGGNHLAPEINVLNGLRAQGIPVEAHWYQDGPHGTSMSPGDPQLGQWPDLLLGWMRGLGLIDRTPNPR